MKEKRLLASISRTLQHYGRNVYYQQGNMDFKGFLRFQGISFIELPNLDYDIVFYTINGKDRYAVINSSDELGEEIYLTDSIPLDMDWSALIKDCDGQFRGESPMEMTTKAKLILDRACSDVIEESDDLFNPPKAPSIEDIRLAIIKRGWSIKELSMMSHYDVDTEFWKSIVSE